MKVLFLYLSFTYYVFRSQLQMYRVHCVFDLWFRLDSGIYYCKTQLRVLMVVFFSENS